MSNWMVILYLAVLGACVGSFLNVVVWRLPRVQGIEGESLLRGFWRSVVALSEPPSHCPRCNQLLKWHDNLPVIGWIRLGGKCRFCRQPISPRYPIIEAITGLLFAGYYYAFYVVHAGPCLGVAASGPLAHVVAHFGDNWWIYGLDMVLLSGLLAASLIDAELYIIPMEIPWVIALIAVATHAMFDGKLTPGGLFVGPLPAALALGSTLGVALSNLLVWRGVFPRAFAEGTPMLEIERQARDQKAAVESVSRHAAASASASAVELERSVTGAASRRDPKSAHKHPRGAGKKSGKNGAITKPPKKKKAVNPVASSSAGPREFSPRETRIEIGKELLFLLPPIVLGIVSVLVAGQVAAGRVWAQAISIRWVAALCGSLLGGLVGGFTVWLTRILGSLAFGREAMGMGDVDLMVGVGAALGAGAAVVAFFIAPFFGIVYAIYMLLTGNKRELPYGPYLSLGTAAVMLFYCPIAAYFGPGLSNLAWLMRSLIS